MSLAISCRDRFTFAVKATSLYTVSCQYEREPPSAPDHTPWGAYRSHLPQAVTQILLNPVTCVTVQSVYTAQSSYMCHSPVWLHCSIQLHVSQSCMVTLLNPVTCVTVPSGYTAQSSYMCHSPSGYTAQSGYMCHSPIWLDCSI